MSTILQLPYTLGVLLEFVLLLFLLRGPYRKYTVFSLYIFASFITNVVVEATYYTVGFKSSTYRTLYWTQEVAQDVLLFLVVIACTYEALRGNPMRPKAAKVLGGIVLVALLLPFSLLHNHPSRQYGFFSSQWFNHATQIWNFGAAIMNLVLWTALLSNRRRDPQLVTVSIGVGIATASFAIAWGARQWLAPENRWPADLFYMIAQMGSLLLWCWVFRPKSASPSGSATPPGGSKPPSSLPPPNALTTPS